MADTHRICLFPHLGYLSETSRMIAVYKALVAAGEEPVMASHGGTYDWVLEQEGIPWRLIEPEMSVERCQAFVKANRIDGGLGGFYQADELEQIVRHEIDFLVSGKFDAVLTGFNLSLGLSARKAGCLYCVTHLGSWNPIIFEREMQTPFNYLTYKIPKLIPRAWIRRLVNRIYRTSKIKTGVCNKVAGKLSIEPFHSTMDMFMGDLTLVTECPEVLGISQEDMESWKPRQPDFFHSNLRLKYAGPLYAQLFGEVEEDVLRFLNSPNNKIYVALTSSRPDYIQGVVNALLELDASILLAGTVHDLRIDSDKLIIKKYLPSHLIMPRMDLAVIHGGQGSVQTAIASGTPILGFPLQTEQMFNLELIQQRGAGINLPLQLMGKPELIRDAAEEILNTKSYRTEVRKMQSIYGRYNGPAEVARILLDEVL